MLVPGGDRQELVDALAESLGVLLPELVVQEHAHGVHADASAQPSSLSICAGLKVSACHISSWLMASAGM